MAIIKGKGVPTRKTAGALGDIYIDTASGKRFKCMGAYNISSLGVTQKDYDWKKESSDNVVEQPVPEVKPVKEEVKEEPKAEVVEEVKEEPVAAPKKSHKSKAKEAAKVDGEPVESAPKRTDYTAYSNKAK